MNKNNNIKNTVIQKDVFDQMSWDEIKTAKNVRELFYNDSEEGLAQDVFNGLYKSKPAIEETTQSLLQKNIIEQMMGLPEFKQLRSDTQVDEVASAIGTIELAPQIIQQFKEILNKQNSSPNKKLEEIMDEGEMANLRQSFRKAISKSQEISSSLEEISNAWGLNSEEMKAVPFKERMDIAARLMNNNKFKKLTDLIGKFKNIMSADRATHESGGYTEIVDTGLGDDIPRLVPSEFFKFSKQKTLFYKDFLEKKLLNYSLVGIENLGKGPLIVCQDKSASMEGNPDRWATAVSMALSELAAKQNRAFGAIYFDTEILKTYFWSKGKAPTPQEKIDMASNSTAGGTDFFTAFNAAFEMKSYEKTLKTSDIVIITDGECNLTDDQVDSIFKMKKEANTRIYWISFNEHKDGFLKNPKLAELCDQISIINSFGDIDTFKNLIKTVSAS